MENHISYGNKHVYGFRLSGITNMVDGKNKCIAWKIQIDNYDPAVIK